MKLLSVTDEYLLVLFYSDKNECDSQVTGCSPHATCADTDGSFTCQCKPGYYGNGFKCAGKNFSFISNHYQLCLIVTKNVM